MKQKYWRSPGKFSLTNLVNASKNSYVDNRALKKGPCSEDQADIV
jgi:hypothetical protein